MLDLKDFRGKITAEADCVLEAESRVTGRERQEIVRQILHEWALQRIEVHTVLEKRLRAEGLAVASGGMAGNRGERQA